MRRQCALTLARITERESAVARPARRGLRRHPARAGRRPGGWGEEETDTGPSEESNPEVRPQTAAERGLAHVFTLLSLAVEREPLQIAYWAVLGADPGLRGTALEYLENVLPDDVRRALWPYLGARAQVPAGQAIARAARTGPAALERHPRPQPAGPEEDDAAPLIRPRG